MTAVAYPADRSRFAGWTLDRSPNAAKTLQDMAGKCHAAMTDPVVIDFSRHLIAAARPRDYPAQIHGLLTFGRCYFRFVDNPDPTGGVQLVRTPRDMIDDVVSLRYVQGACDDAAVLMATLGMANGLYTRFRAVAFSSRWEPDDNAPLTHVITDIHDGQVWQAVDITRPEDLLRAPHIVRTLILEL